jgi:hypothetical protein
LAGLKRASQKAINFEKLQEIIQDKTENPSTFLDRLTRALQQYTNIDPESTDGKQLLMTYFFSQSYPDIRAKLKKLDRGPRLLRLKCWQLPSRCSSPRMKRQNAKNTRCWLRL